MCSLNRTLSLSVFPREPAASLDTTVDYVKVGTTNVLVYLHIIEKTGIAAGGNITVTANKTWIVVVLNCQHSLRKHGNCFRYFPCGTNLCCAVVDCLSSDTHYISCTH